MNVSRCRACNAEILFLPTKRGKINPINLDSLPIPEGAIPAEYIAALPATTLFDYNTHVSHFLTCPETSKFKKLGQRHKDKSEAKLPKPDTIQDSFDWVDAKTNSDAKQAMDREDWRQ